MSRYIIITIMCSVFFTSTAFAEGWGHHHHYGFGGYGYGYNPYFGGNVYMAPAYMPVQRPYYGPPPPVNYYAYGPQMHYYGHYRDRDRW